MSTLFTNASQPPIGTLTIAADTGGLRHVIPDNRHPVDRFDWAQGARGNTADALGATRGQLLEYFAGTRRDFDLPLAPQGTTFQMQVWRMLATIPFGDTWSYRDLRARHRQARCHRCGRRGERAQPAADRAALPSCDRRRRQPDRLRRRAAHQNAAASGRRAAGLPAQRQRLFGWQTQSRIKAKRPARGRRLVEWNPGSADRWIQHAQHVVDIHLAVRAMSSLV